MNSLEQLEKQLADPKYTIDVLDPNGKTIDRAISYNQIRQVSTGLTDYLIKLHSNYPIETFNIQLKNLKEHSSKR